MASPPRSMDFWRKFLRSASSDIFEVIEQAILVAASDYPEEFRSRRDRIGEKFYTALLQRCDRCDPNQLQGVEREEGRGSVRRVAEESRVYSSIDDLGCSNNPAVLSNYTCDEADTEEEGQKIGEILGRDIEEEGQKIGEILRRDIEEEGQKVGEILRREIEEEGQKIGEILRRDIEEEGQNVGEILRIKEIFHNEDDESDGALLESLRRLQKMEITVDVMNATEIGKAVNSLRKCKSKQIRQLACTMIKDWKVLVDEWISDNAAITANTQNPSPVNDEGRLGAPLLEEGRALLAFQTSQTSQTSSIPLSQNSDGMDHDRNLRNIAEFDSSQKSEQKSRGKDETVKRSSASTRPMTNLANEQKIRSNTKAKPPQRKPLAVIQDGSKNDDESSIKARLEITKRKLHQGYEQAENARKQRTIQTVEPPDLPKRAHGSLPTLKIKCRSKLQSNGQ